MGRNPSTVEEEVMSEFLNTFAFAVFPYIALAVSVAGHVYRYIADPYTWNARSSEILESKKLWFASNLFHYGVILALVGHVVGLLVPQGLYDAFWISGELHTEIAYLLGAAFGAPAFLGIILLLWRRTTDSRVVAVTTQRDIITSVLLLIVIGVGTYNVFFGHYYVLDTVAPWIRGIFNFNPDPALMRDVPFLYKLHIFAAFALFAFAPFSRLVHIWSIPVSYARRSYILFRRRSLEI
jgi:nitrate reductase gamma subunit